MEALTMKEKKKISRLMAQRYQKAGKKEKGALLRELVTLTGYNRCYGSWVLRNWGREVVIYRGRRRLVFIGEWTGHGKKRTREKEKIYDEKVLVELKKIWYLLNFPCSRRMADYMEEIVNSLERHEEIVLDDSTRNKLLNISARTIDRLLKAERKKLEIKGRSGTKPGMLLKSQIPVRTFAQWDEQKPGFVEMDLVSHEGQEARGIYAHTLNMTDIHTGWTETIAVANKSQTRVFAGLKKSISNFPFSVLGLDSDNGSEFINNHLRRYCEQEKITFTRSRAYRKNDSCYVEQKNWHLVRKTVGYWRYETAKEVFLLNRIYEVLRLYSNFFQPQMKLIKKTRVGSKVTKKYDRAQTPLQRILNCRDVEKESKQLLHKQYLSLNPVHLRKQLSALQNQLYKTVSKNPFYQARQELKHKKASVVGIDF